MVFKNLHKIGATIFYITVNLMNWTSISLKVQEIIFDKNCSENELNLIVTPFLDFIDSHEYIDRKKTVRSR